MSVCGASYPTLEQCQKAHRDLIWFTYRKNFKINLTLHSDVGWGCLIRVAQMAMAHALEKYFALNHKRV
jgi:cysteine protease ATG4